MEGSTRQGTGAKSAAELMAEIKGRVEEVEPIDVADGLVEEAVIVDVREDPELAGGVIPGSAHIPRSYLEQRIETAAPDRSKPVVLYCAGGVRSLFAAQALIDGMGYEDVRSMRGGFQLWKDNGLPFDVPQTLT
jgi:rhodanese-related sulfurtransferase